MAAAMLTPTLFLLKVNELLNIRDLYFCTT